ncbi:MAG: alkaline ceramidase, partial [Oscillospiraceae bacterium]|nr:alkaline ceramidase [Oscillospiraceae bacterium]
MKNKTLMLGFSETDITPFTPIETVGFGRADEMSRGILHSLSAQVAVWQLGEKRCCVVTIDHIGFSKQHANSLRDEMGKVLRISREKIMLC